MRFPAPFFYLAIICLGPAGTSCSIKLIHPSSTERSTFVREAPANLEWPERLPGTYPGFERKSGKSPEPLGLYRHCRVLALSPGAPNPLLLFASRTREPVRIGGKKIDIDFSVDDINESRFVSGHHRLTIVELESARAKPVRGTVLYLGSIMGISPPEQKMLSALRLDGWNIIACLPPIESFADEEEIPINGPRDLAGAAKRFANRLDQHFAERAYVAESAIAYVKRNRPDWLQGSMVIVGSSAGALALPAVVARIGPVDSAVLIGGGANIPEIMLHSSLKLAKPFMQTTERGGTGNKRSLTEAEFARLKALAFEHMKFDPAKLAPVLDKTPTLLLLATLDAIVPAENGVLLYQKLRNPERWKYPVGHNLLMMSLPSRAERIKGWIRSNHSAEISTSPIDYEKRKRTRVTIEDNTAAESNSSR